MSEQLRTLEHVLFARLHPPRRPWSWPSSCWPYYLLIRPAPSTPDNGSTAVEVALKMTLQYFHNQGQPERRTFICFRDSYHGDTFGAMAVSGRGAFTEPFWPAAVRGWEFIDVPVPGREAEVLAQLDALLTRPDVAGFIFEPLVLGTAGMVMYEPAVLSELLRRCHRHGVLGIADEVMTGFGRTGPAVCQQPYLPSSPTSCAFPRA